MENNKYLSIAQFAEAAKVSKQAIYKQVNNENSQLAPYILRDGKKTMISISALFDLYGVEIENLTFSTLSDENTTENQPNSTIRQPETTHEMQPDSTYNQPDSIPENQPVSADYIAFLKAEIEELKAEKYKSEKRLNEQIKEKDEIIKTQSEQLATLAKQVADIASKAIVTTSQQQYLTAAEKVMGQQEPPTDEIIQQAEPKERKKGFFSRIFGK